MSQKEDPKLWWIEHMQLFLAASEYNSVGQREVWHNGVIVVEKDAEDSIMVSVRIRIKDDVTFWMDQWQKVIDEIKGRARAALVRKITLKVMWGTKNPHVAHTQIFTIY